MTSPADIALVVGGSEQVFEEYRAALSLCQQYNKSTMNFVCNDSIGLLPDAIDNAVTLHPDKMMIWIKQRLDRGFPPIKEIWGHRPVVGFTRHTKDWGGSSGLLCTKIARELGFTHVILCGVPMSVEGKHVVRKVRWNSAHGFRRGWTREIIRLRPFVRSMDGWTQEQFGRPEREWLEAVIPDRHPMRVQRHDIKA